MKQEKTGKSCDLPVFLFWWTIRDSKPGTIAKMKQKQAKNMRKVLVLRVVPQLCPKMPQRKALIKTLITKGNVHGFHPYTFVLISLRNTANIFAI